MARGCARHFEAIWGVPGEGSWLDFLEIRTGNKKQNSKYIIYVALYKQIMKKVWNMFPKGHASVRDDGGRASGREEEISPNPYKTLQKLTFGGGARVREALLGNLGGPWGGILAQKRRRQR